MKILSIIAQKPNSTGSGVYLAELLRCFKNMGHINEIICACYENDNIIDEKDIHYNKIVFNTKDVPIKIAGMSDVMPYETIKYSDFIDNPKMLEIWKNVFINKTLETIIRFKPDLIICHHLYLLTAIIENLFDGNYRPKIYAICHNTDLRQYRQTDLEREFIKENIVKLDKIFFPSNEHMKIAKELFNFDDSVMKVVGIGYNNNIFKRINIDNIDKYNKSLLYVGKVSKKKGVLSLVKAINLLNDEAISLDIIGGIGDIDEYNEILDESKKSKSIINFIKPMSQDKLAIEYNKHNIFILPSFSEGIPMVPIEAMACGAKVVISNLPGVKDFYDANIKNANIKYVKLPNLTNVDDANDDEISAFEERLACAIKESINDNNNSNPILNNISWENIAKTMLYQ